MNLRKPISVLALSLVLILPSLVFFAYRVQQWQVRHEMEEKLESAYLETVSIPINEIDWFEEGKELLVNGKLFDVKSSTKIGSQIIFTGLYDEKETKIREKIKLVQQQNGQDQESNRLTHRVVSFVWYAEQLPVIHTHSPIPENSDYLYPEMTNILSATLAIPSPPPKS